MTLITDKLETMFEIFIESELEFYEDENNEDEFYLYKDEMYLESKEIMYQAYILMLIFDIDISDSSQILDLILVVSENNLTYQSFN